MGPPPMVDSDDEEDEDHALWQAERAGERKEQEAEFDADMNGGVKFENEELKTQGNGHGDQRYAGPSGSVLTSCGAKPRSLLDEMTERHNQQLRLADVVLPSGEVHVAQQEVPRYVSMEVVLDSGAGAHVANRRHVPSYQVVPS